MSGNGALARSNYSRRQATVGVVHLGVGAFHRAHQAVYFDALMDKTGDLRWAIAGVNLRAGQSADLARLQHGDGCYVLKTMPAQANPRYRQIRAHKAFYDWAEQPAAAEAAVADPEVRLLSLTVTEGGYCLNDGHALDLANPEIQAELAGAAPTSVYAFLRRALTRRRDAGAGALTVLCCDNLRDNGRLLQRSFAAYLQAAGDRQLSRWLDGNVTFPCTMVDRITPSIDAATAAEVAHKFGIEQDVSVRAEDFIQWVIEDKFAGERPRLEAVGAQIVASVEPYENAKLRVLNGGHACIAYLGALKGHATFDAALRDPELEAFFDAYLTEEAIPALGADSPLDLPAYYRQVKQRFLNAQISDSIERITKDGVSKMPMFILPTVRARLAAGAVPKRGLAVVAAWYVFMRHAAAGRLAFKYDEPHWAAVSGLLAAGCEDKFAACSRLWSDTPERYGAFAAELGAQIRAAAKRFPI